MLGRRVKLAASLPEAREYSSEQRNLGFPTGNSLWQTIRQEAKSVQYGSR
jgi:hypothetical protein